jgi:hypothetical protein
MDLVVVISPPHSGHLTRSLGAPYPITVPTTTDFSRPKAAQSEFEHIARIFISVMTLMGMFAPTAQLDRSKNAVQSVKLMFGPLPKPGEKP